MTDRFVAIDFETANPNSSSICQIGAVTYQGGDIVDKWSSLVNPEDFFFGMNVSIHGIDEDVVANAPIFPEIFEQFVTRITGQIVVHHTAFDKGALDRVCKKYHLPIPECQWLDSARVTRRAWTEYSRKGYGLKDVCNTLGIKFIHHDALEDARAAGRIMIIAMAETGLTLEDWLERVSRPIHIVNYEGNSNGPLFGEGINFTGSFSMTQAELKNLASNMGCDVLKGVTKRTTILVVGIQDPRKLKGYENSEKHRKAEALIKKGQSIKIIDETDFRHIIDTESEIF